MGLQKHNFAPSEEVQFGQWQQAHERLPYVPRAILAKCLRRLSGASLERALRHGVVPIAWLPNKVFYARVEGFADVSGFTIVAIATPADFHWAVRQALGRKLGFEAAQNLKRHAPIFSAHKRLWVSQRISILAAVVSLAAALIFASPATIFDLFGFVFSLLFSLMVMVRLLALLTPRTPTARVPKLTDDHLPVYTVLVPLFREVSVLPQVVAAMSLLNYPCDKLDLKLVLEESDLAMQRAVARLTLPPHFEVHLVPKGRPQTKPRALNYAMRFARGELLTIYDAEDIPEPMQLRLAADAFASAPPTTACLQAELAYYNSQENWLTRQFAAEYATLFTLVLPALAQWKLPLPLGGTSNHFRTSALRAVGGWDAYNVTEDADLGFRLARLGYRTGALDSITYEEAVTSLGGWLHQRARWFKGFIQTWLVHMRRPMALVDEIRLRGFIILQAMVLGVVATSLFYPVFLMVTALAVWQMLSGGAHDFARIFYVSQFALGMAVMQYSAHVALRRKHMGSAWIALTLPAYWMLAFAAAVKAMWQLCFAPFHWNKTRHGATAFAPTSRANVKLR